jgi:hypothetical protein
LVPNRSFASVDQGPRPSHEFRWGEEILFVFACLGAASVGGILAVVVQPFAFFASIVGWPVLAVMIAVPLWFALRDPRILALAKGPSILLAAFAVKGFAFGKLFLALATAA